MTFKIIISFTFVVCLCLANALNLPKISNNLFITGRSPSPLPTPSPQVLECFNDIYSQAIECRNNAIKNWNITDKSPVKDLCCAEWDLIDCDLGEAQVCILFHLLFIIFSQFCQNRVKRFKNIKLMKININVF